MCEDKPKRKDRDIVAELQEMLDEAGMQATFYGKPVNLVELRDDMAVRIAEAVVDVHKSKSKE